MADITVNGRIKLKTFQAQFIKAYPYLVPTLQDKAGARLNNDYTISKCATIVNGEWKPVKEEDLSINGNLLVGTLERRFKELFGVPCQVVYRRSGRHFGTGEAFDKLSLSKANALAKENGYEPIDLSTIASYI